MFFLKVFSLTKALRLLALLSLVLSACQAALPAAANHLTATPAGNTPTAAKTAVLTATIMPTGTPAPLTLWLPTYLPEPLRGAVQLPDGWSAAQNEAQARLRLDVQPAEPIDASAGSGTVPWVYALAAPFPTITDEIASADLKTFWKTGVPASQNFPFRSLLVDSTTQAVFTSLWGPSGPGVRVVPSGDLVDTAWQQKDAWAILPFEALEPRWKVILVDGQSPLRKEFKQEQYALTVPFSLQGSAGLREDILAKIALPQSNRRADHLTTVMLTGVTALVRGTGSFMETFGVDYPAKNIGDWLRGADILHISNEVAFAENCPLPHNWEGLHFCSRTKYLKLLEDIGTDVVELSGDHFSDWGPEAVLYTLGLYRKEGWKTYAGGANIEEARKPALFEHNGNKIAFLGCNAKPPGYALASETTPGALHCDMQQMASEVTNLHAAGYLPIVTFQHLEYYSYTANPILQADFRQMADAGAVIVSGSQAHQPHAFEFKDGGMLHYGLGNLFFDQTNQGDAPRTAFIDRHVFYEGRYIGTELLTIYFVDYALSRPMTAKERADLLRVVFQASGW